ncbi:MAG: hypothetical protein KL785_03795 [Brevundimonas sp.]|nr:hypothetical protein [Brevundimonas sp.]
MLNEKTMIPSGYDWILRPEGDGWRWKAIGRDDGAVLVEGVAGSRAEGAAFLARAISLGVLSQMQVPAA